MKKEAENYRNCRMFDKTMIRHQFKTCNTSDNLKMPLIIYNNLMLIVQVCVCIYMEIAVAKYQKNNKGKGKTKNTNSVSKKNNCI